MPRIIYDKSKGFCCGDSADKKIHLPSNIIKSNGFDQLPWDEFIPAVEEDEGQIDELIDLHSDSNTKKKMTKQEKWEQRQFKKIKAARNKQIKRQQELHGGASDSYVKEEEQFNPYLAKLQIKSLYSRIIKLSNEAKAKEFKILQYHSIALYKSDLGHILPEEWLNDNNISLVYELINQHFLKNTQHRSFSYQIQLLYPSLVQLFLYFPSVSDIESILPVDELKKSKFVFIPINFIDDYQDVDLEDVNNGDHWALGLFCLLNNKLYIYDSMALGDKESESEKNVLDEIVKRLSLCKSFVKSNKKIEIVKMKCDQQDNFDDCGVYLIMITCFLIKRLLFDGSIINLNLGKIKFNPLKGRLYMIQLIYRLLNIAS